MKIGILGMQGDIEEHLAVMEKIGVESLRVKSPETLETVNGLIIPGGESTTMLKLLKITGLFEVLRKKIKEGFPVYGTCAGLILLANDVYSPAQDSLKVLDIAVNRNGYGRQINSFNAEISIPIIDEKPFNAVFIRAPVIVKTGNVDVLSIYNGMPVFVKHDNILASTFHPELSDDVRVHEFFLGMIKNAVGR